MVEDSERIVFVHVPRTGGHSVFKSLIVPNDNVVGKDHDTRRPEYETTDEFINKEDFVFTFVRNPYERVVSSYFYLKEGGRNKQDEIEGIKYLREYDSFKEFILNGLETVVDEQLHFYPQVFWITNSEDELVVDYIETIKEINKNLEYISQKFNLEFDPGYYLNTCGYKKWNFYYDDFRVVEKVRSLYFEDIKLYAKVLKNEVSLRGA